VVYPEDRVTHFRPFKDNVRISLLNTLTVLRLLLPLPLAPLIRDRFRKPGLSGDALRRWSWLGGPGPFWRMAGPLLAFFLGPWSLLAGAVIGSGAAPAALSLAAIGALARYGLAPLYSAVGLTVLLFVFGLVEMSARHKSIREFHESTKRAWGAPSRGGYWGHLFFVVVVRVFGAAIAYFFLCPITVYFLVAAPEHRRAWMEYLGRALGPATGLKRWVRSYKHFLAFAR